MFYSSVSVCVCVCVCMYVCMYIYIYIQGQLLGLHHSALGFEWKLGSTKRRNNLMCDITCVCCSGQRICECVCEEIIVLRVRVYGQIILPKCSRIYTHIGEWI